MQKDTVKRISGIADSPRKPTDRHFPAMSLGLGKTDSDVTVIVARHIAITQTYLLSFAKLELQPSDKRDRLQSPFAASFLASFGIPKKHPHGIILLVRNF